MAPIYFPLRWESTGDQWWYASPIDWAAANGHYDLVRELLRLDNNHLIKLTSLRRIKRLESVWDDNAHFHDVAKFRSQVARKLLAECESTSKKGKNSLIGAGYGGWLIYTAASAGDLSFVQELLDRDPLLVFGEGEFGVTDILYAAARSKNCEVFSVLYDFAVSPRFSTKGGEVVEHIGDFPPLYRAEMMNRAVHAAARGGNLVVLKELLGDCSDVLAYRDVHGSTILHAAAGKGQVEVVKYLLETYKIADTTDDRGNTALNLAAFKGQPATVRALLTASPSSVSIRNNAGETFLHMAVSGFQTPGFRRLDRQMELIKQLIDSDALNVQDIINVKNNDGRTALHAAIVGNLHSELVELLMTVRTIDVNIKDGDNMTPLDLLKMKPKSASSDILIRHLVSVGGMFGSTRQSIASQLKMQGCGTSPGTLFRVSDSEILSYTGVESGPAEIDLVGPTSSSFDSTNENNNNNPKPSSVNYAAQQIKKVLHWRNPKPEKPTQKKPEESPVPLRERFSKVPSHKRTLSVRSNISSPTNRKKLAMGVMESMPHLSVSRRKTPSSSFSRTSVSSPCSVDKQKGVLLDEEDATTRLSEKQGGGSIGKRLRRQYFCFGGSSIAVKKSVVRCPVASVA